MLSLHVVWTGMRKSGLWTRADKRFPLPDFFLIIFFKFYSFTILFFFPNTFQYPQRVYLQSLLLLNIPTFQTLALLFLLPVCSSLLAFPMVSHTMHLSWNWLPGGTEETHSGLTLNQATGLSEEVSQATRQSWEVELSPHCC